jgi:hypothetical protein
MLLHAGGWSGSWRPLAGSRQAPAADHCDQARKFTYEPAEITLLNELVIFS